MVYKCDKCAFKTNFKYKLMKHKRINKCSLYDNKKSTTQEVNENIVQIAEDLNYISTEMSNVLKVEFTDILGNSYTEDVKLNIRQKKDELDKYVEISNSTLLHIIIWYYIRIFNIKIKKTNMKMDDGDLNKYFIKFLNLESQRSMEYREYKIQLMQEAIYCFSERYEYDLTSGFENIF